MRGSRGDRTSCETFLTENPEGKTSLVAPERRYVVQLPAMSAKLSLAAGKHLVVRFEHGNPGVSGGASRLDLRKEFGHKLVRDANVICVAEVALEAFEPTDKSL